MRLIRFFQRLFSRHVFISYSSRDAEMAEKLCRRLVSDGFRVWEDVKNVPTGAVSSDSIYRAIRRSSCVLILASENSVASAWVQEEVRYAIAHRKRILIHRLDPVMLPEWLKVLDTLQRSHHVEQTLTYLRRTRRIEHAKMAAAVAAALFLSMVVWNHGKTEREVEIGSVRVPVEIHADGARLAALDSKVSHQTFRLTTGRHVFLAKNEEWLAEKQVHIPAGSDTYVVWFDLADFHHSK
ncbi:toll/interleukin-1 receptor domain-containing protein [Prosthecobacter sp.]|uniref:toll/interleukin-1 receptor domain-containing protein n=1 Tax=Prosthecobacter sp. TaxID=1965333 RepID=UPI0037845126